VVAAGAEVTLVTAPVAKVASVFAVVGLIAPPTSVKTRPLAAISRPARRDAIRSVGMRPRTVATTPVTRAASPSMMSAPPAPGCRGGRNGQQQKQGVWPLSVKPLIDQVITQFVISADNDHQLSAVTNTDSWNQVLARGEPAANEGARVSTLIRLALGLPQRKAD